MKPRNSFITVYCVKTVSPYFKIFFPRPTHRYSKCKYILRTDLKEDSLQDVKLCLRRSSKETETTTDDLSFQRF